MKNNKSKNCFVWIFQFTFGQLAYCSGQAKEANLKDQIEITIWSQFKVLMAIFFTKCISLLASDQQFLYYILKQCLSGLELIRAHWGMLYCSPMFN